MDYRELQQEILKNVEEIDRYINSNVNIAQDTLQAASKHLFSAGGKRIRPFVLRNAYQIFNPWSQKPIPIAAALEILHTFTLLHDDIMDHDKFRRGIPTVHVKWGEEMAILAGDALHALVFSILHQSDFSSDTRVKVMGDFANTLIKICEGQSQDMIFESQSMVSLEEYIDMIQLKTGELLSLSARVGGLIGNATESEVDCLSSFGLHYGIAFQIIDDILGVTAEESELGKPIGSDIRQGKKTFLTLFTLEHARSADQARFKNILTTKSNDLTDIAFGIELIKTTGALAKAQEMAQYYTTIAIQDLAPLPNSIGKKNLTSLAQYSLNRGF